MQGINIYSGEKGLGGCLTNPTELAFKKGNINKHYPIRVHNKQWPDVETCYLATRAEVPFGATAAETAQILEANDRMMVELLVLKFKQHPDLFAEVQSKGGAIFLENCSHFTHAKSGDFKGWEGQGLQSRFIRNLVTAFQLVQSPHSAILGQGELF